MKLPRIAFILALALTATLFGQTVTESLVRIQCDPASGSAQAFFDKKVTVGDATYVSPGWTQVAWQIGSDKTVTVGDKTLTYAEVFLAVQAIANAEKAAQAAPPAPENPVTDTRSLWSTQNSLASTWGAATPAVIRTDTLPGEMKLYASK